MRERLITGLLSLAAYMSERVPVDSDRWPKHLDQIARILDLVDRVRALT